MFLERVPTSILDSGGAYGYGFKRMRTRPPDKQPGGRLRPELDYTSRGIDLGASINTFKWLLEKVEYDHDMTVKMKAWIAKGDGWADDWVAQLPGATGLYGEGDPINDNTYNHEQIFDSDFQFTWWEQAHRDRADCDTFVALAIHGGCDIRGGYSATKVFRVDDEFMNWPDHTLSSRSNDRRVGPMWALNSALEFEPVVAIDEFTDLWGRPEIEDARQFDKYEWLGPKDASPGVSVEKYAGQGRIVVNDLNQILCPHTGQPLELAP